MDYRKIIEDLVDVDIPVDKELRRAAAVAIRELLEMLAAIEFVGDLFLLTFLSALILVLIACLYVGYKQFKEEYLDEN